MKPEHQKFAEAWVKSQNATDAYVKATGNTRSRKTAETLGHRWLKRKDVQTHIEQIRGQAVILLGNPRFAKDGRRAAADLAEVLAILTAQARGDTATEFERTRVTVGEAVGNPFNTVPIPPIVGELLKLVPEDKREEARQKAMEITLESRTMTFQPMKAAGLLLGHFDKVQESRNPGDDSAWVRIMDEDPKLARLLSIKFLQIQRSA